MIKQKAILCVDDEEIILNSLVNQIEDVVGSEYIVEASDSVEHAFEIIDDLDKENIELAVVISDYIMPEINGDEFLIKINEIHPDTLKIMLTGHADLDGIQNAINKAGLYRFMTKPWSHHDLELTLKEAVKSFTQNLEIKDHQRLLEKKIQERTKEIENANKVLEKNNAQLSRYINLFKEYSLYSETDLEGNITDISDSLCMLTGYGKSEFIGKTHAMLSHKDNEAKYVEMWEYITKGMAWHGELKNIKSDGDVFWTDVIVYPKLDENDNVVGYSAARKDITERKIIEKISITDPLTKIYNRRHFNNIFTKEMNRAKREENNLVFMMIDIDNFKKYNDTYGHQIGDETLITVANILKETTKRANDYAFRLGGEEFCIITSSMSNDEVRNFAQKVRMNVENKHIEHKTNTASPYVTISIGIFIMEPNMNYSEDDIIKFADDALYEVKESGRNNYHIKQVH